MVYYAAVCCEFMYLYLFPIPDYGIGLLVDISMTLIQ
jgi:hypothetical protein